MSHHKTAVRNPHGNGELLLDQQHRDTPFAQFLQVFGNQFHDLGSEALGRLIDDDEVRVAHERAAQGEHLLLATRQHAGLGVLALLETRKKAVHVLETPAWIALAPLLSEQQVLVHGQLGEDIPVLRHIAQAQVGDLKGLVAQ